MTKKEDKTVTPTQALKIVRANKEERSRKALEEIQQVLNKYDCRMEAYVTIRAGGSIPQIDIVPNERPPMS